MKGRRREEEKRTRVRGKDRESWKRRKETSYRHSESDGVLLTPPEIFSRCKQAPPIHTVCSFYRFLPHLWEVLPRFPCRLTVMRSPPSRNLPETGWGIWGGISCSCADGKCVRAVRARHAVPLEATFCPFRALFPPCRCTRLFTLRTAPQGAGAALPDAPWQRRLCSSSSSSNVKTKPHLVPVLYRS